MAAKLTSGSQYFIVLVTVLCLVQCKEKCYDPTDSDCENYDPCYGKSKTDASFSGVIKGNYKNMEMADTVTSQNVFIFTPTQQFSSSKWKIGSDTTTWTSKQFEINIGNNTGVIPVTLIGKRTPDNNCFPGDDGIDTFTKTIVVVDPKQSKVYGKWHGALQSSPQDTFTINLFISDTSFQEPFYVQKDLPYISNFPKNYSVWVRFYAQYSGLMLEELTGVDIGCQCAAGFIYGKLIDHNTIEIEFKGWDQIANTYIPQKFIGKRK